MKKPPKLLKKTIEISPYNNKFTLLTVTVDNSIFYSFAWHSFYWNCRVKMKKIITEQEQFNKSTFKCIRIGGWRWVDSNTKKRLGNRLDKIKKRDFSYE